MAAGVDQAILENAQPGPKEVERLELAYCPALP
jgi:hypothetical protein